MKLVAVIPHKAIGLPGLRPSALQTLEIGAGPYAAWAVHVRGPAVILVSPAGWLPGVTRIDPTSTKRVAFEVPRSVVSLRWEVDDEAELDKLVRYSAPVREPGSKGNVPEHFDVDAELARAEAENAADSRIQVLEVREVEGPFDDAPMPAIDESPSDGTDDHETPTNGVAPRRRRKHVP